MKILLTLMILLSGCGKAKPMPEFDVESIAPPLKKMQKDGSYKAEFITLNTNINGFLTTSASVQIKDDNFSVSVSLSNSAPQVWHQQAIYSGGRCPTEKDDQNKDGLIDLVEGKAAWGEPLVLLDDDINTQNAGTNFYPISDESGSYVYRRNASFKSIELDLKQELYLEGKILVIFGADQNANLPETVPEHPPLEKYQAFPIACGLILKSTVQSEIIEMEAIGELGLPEGQIPVPEETLPLPPEVEAPEAPAEIQPEEEDDQQWHDRIRRWWDRNING